MLVVQFCIRLTAAKQGNFEDPGRLALRSRLRELTVRHAGQAEHAQTLVATPRLRLSTLQGERLFVTWHTPYQPHRSCLTQGTDG